MHYFLLYMRIPFTTAMTPRIKPRAVFEPRLVLLFIEILKLEMKITQIIPRVTSKIPFSLSFLNIRILFLI